MAEAPCFSGFIHRVLPAYGKPDASDFGIAFDIELFRLFKENCQRGNVKETARKNINEKNPDAKNAYAKPS